MAASLQHAGFLYWLVHEQAIDGESVDLNILCTYPGPYATFSRLVVHPDFRKLGLADSICLNRMFLAAEMGAQVL